MPDISNHNPLAWGHGASRAEKILRATVIHQSILANAADTYRDIHLRFAASMHENVAREAKLALQTLGLRALVLPEPPDNWQAAWTRQRRDRFVMRQHAKPVSFFREPRYIRGTRTGRMSAHTPNWWMVS